MRDIKFRGRIIDSNQWIYGSLINNAFIKDKTKEQCCYIFDNSVFEFDCFEDIGEKISYYEVDPKTIGEFTGLNDSNNKEIYEGDILRLCSDEYRSLIPYGFKGVVSFIESGFYVDNQKDNMFKVWQEIAEWKIIGNIHQNPELC